MLKEHKAFEHKDGSFTQRDIDGLDEQNISAKREVMLMEFVMNKSFLVAGVVGLACLLPATPFLPLLVSMPIAIAAIIGTLHQFRKTQENLCDTKALDVIHYLKTGPNEWHKSNRKSQHLSPWYKDTPERAEATGLRIGPDIGIALNEIINKKNTNKESPIIQIIPIG